MRLLNRNKQSIYFRLLTRDDPVTDENGYLTGERDVEYSSPEHLRCNVSRATGESVAQLFGTQDDYDKIILTEDMGCPIDENSVLIVDDLEGRHRTGWYDYIVKRVAKTLNVIAYAISYVKVQASTAPIELVYAIDANGLYAVDAGGVRARATE